MENNRLIQRIFSRLNLRSLTLHCSMYMHDVFVCINTFVSMKNTYHLLSHPMRSERACYQWRFMNRLNVTPPFSSELFFMQTTWKFFYWEKTPIFDVNTRAFIWFIAIVWLAVSRIKPNESENEVDNQVNVIQIWTIHDCLSQRKYFIGLEDEKNY